MTVPAVETDDRRKHDRVPGPFDAWRVGLIDTPMRIYDVSLGGCFVNAMHEQEVGVPFTLKIQLPHEGWITLKAETLYRRPGFGFAVRFTEIAPEAAQRLERAIDKLLYGGVVEG